jgi:hypothetical protein
MDTSFLDDFDAPRRDLSSALNVIAVGPTQAELARPGKVSEGTFQGQRFSSALSQQVKGLALSFMHHSLRLVEICIAHFYTTLWDLDLPR